MRSHRWIPQVWISNGWFDVSGGKQSNRVALNRKAAFQSNDGVLVTDAMDLVGYGSTKPDGETLYVLMNNEVHAYR